MIKEEGNRAHKPQVILLLTRALHNRNDSRTKARLINDAKDLIKKHWRD